MKLMFDNVIQGVNLEDVCLEKVFMGSVCVILAFSGSDILVFFLIFSSVIL